MPAYVARLERGRYANSTTRRCLNALAHFAHWMSLCRLLAAKLDESRVDQFLQEHLPHCGCTAPVMRHPREAHAALMPLLAILRQHHVIAEVPVASGPVADELRRYDDYMRDTRGLASATRSNPTLTVPGHVFRRKRSNPLICLGGCLPLRRNS